MTSAPAGIDCGATCTASYSYNTTVTLTATPALGSAFTGWSGGACTGTDPCVVTVTAATTVTATFAVQSFAVTLIPSGAGIGTVTSAPAGVDCGATCTASYAYNTTVALTATPAVGSVFTGWSGGGCSGTDPCMVTVTAATTVTATFALQNFTLTLAPSGTGTGTVTSAPAGIDCGATCTASYAYNTTVTLTATPAVGSVFTGWSGGGCSGTAPCVVTVTAATTVTPTFVTVLPALPAAFVDITMPTTSTTVTVCPSGCDFSDLQTALDTVSLDTTIVLTAGVAYPGPFTLPNKAGAGWIVIQSSALASLPSEGSRVGPPNAGAMPTITANGLPVVAIQTATGAHHYRLVGLEISASNDTTGGILRLGDSAEPLLANQAHHIVVDRCYIHGDGLHNVRRGIQFELADGAIIDSYLSDFVDSAGDAQAINTLNAPGPLGIYNNYLEASGANILFGGGDPAIPNLIPSDIHVQGNYLSKPLAWLSSPWLVGNVFESTNSRRVLVENNVLENSWAGTQGGYIFSLTSANQGNTAPWSQTVDMTIRYNLLRNASGAFTIAGNSEPNPVTNPSTRVYVHDNLAVGMTNQAGDLSPYQVVGLATDITIDHNTVAASPGSSAALVLDDTDAQVLRRLVFTNNIVAAGIYGVTNLGPSGGDGTTALANAAPGYVFTNNVLAGIDVNQYPLGNFGPSDSPDDDANIGYADAVGGNFKLSASSPFRGAGTDGRDIGADIDGINVAAAAVIAGSTTPQMIVSTAGTGSGTVTSSPPGIGCPGVCSSTFELGTVVTLTATPAAGSVFTGWSGGACSGTG
ncbi:MAG: hypothetical protein DME11_17930, partial [Candidatus Rokuibacteriota bacterium]